MTPTDHISVANVIASKFTTSGATNWKSQQTLEINKELSTKQNGELLDSGPFLGEWKMKKVA